jgi:hypothetical protein
MCLLKLNGWVVPKNSSVLLPPHLVEQSLFATQSEAPEASMEKKLDLPSRRLVSLPWLKGLFVTVSKIVVCRNSEFVLFVFFGAGGKLH